ncbi:MAG TPA: alcohol dehydrogenase catalytic domain-containing protein [Candidatus Dormibacteraeota bacterium]|nr:alcohol dehydrogenase catalytic domain-containing protein [Candidatus Dormibacteraeota bacterium]
MRAVKLVEAHRLETVELPDPEPHDAEVVIRVDGCGICGSDLSAYKVGLFSDNVPGHEFAGTIAAVGSGVDGWSVGDRAVVDPKLPCGVCEECTSGNAHRCAFALTAGLGFARPGGFAELVLAPAHRLHRLPDSLSLRDACLVEPLSVAIHGVEKAPGLDSGPAVVIGLGPIGLFTVAVLADRGVETIIGVDPVADRRRLAEQLGAHSTVAGAGDVRAAISSAVRVYECSGHPDVLHTAADLVAPGGALVLLGVPFGEAKVAPLMWVTREITVVGSIASSEDDFAAAIKMLARNRAVSSVATRRVGFDQVPEVFEDLIAPSAGGKVVVDPAL